VLVNVAGCLSGCLAGLWLVRYLSAS
jgi:hypothetical protein